MSEHASRTPGTRGLAADTFREVYGDTILVNVETVLQAHTYLHEWVNKGEMRESSHLTFSSM